jgi:hypothetical protein
MRFFLNEIDSHLQQITLPHGILIFCRVGVEGHPPTHKITIFSKGMVYSKPNKTLRFITMKRIIHINQHVIKSNRKNNETKPPITCKTYKETIYGHGVRFVDGTVVYRPNDPLSCGAHVWIETHHEILISTDDGIIPL